MNRRKRSVVNRRRRSLLVERLEPRYVMALGWVGPDNGNSSYGHAANWNPAQVPTATDDVNIQGFTGTISLDANAVSRAMRVKMSSVDIALAGKTLSLADLVVTDVGDVGPASLRVVGPGTIVVEQAGAPNGSAKIGQRGQAGTLTLDGVEQARVEGGVYLGGLPAVQGGENTSDGVLQVNNSTLNTLTLEIGDEQSSKGSANFDNSFLDLQSPGLPAPGALPPGFPLPGPGLGLGNLIVGVEGTGTTAFKNSSGLVGPIFVGRQGKGDLTVEGGTFYGYDHFRVGFSAQGDVTLKNSAQSTTEFYVLGTVDVGVNAIGTGTMTVSDPGTLLETGDLIVGNAGTGSLDIKNFGAAHVRVGGTTTVGQAGSGTVRIHTNGTLETNSASLAVAATGTANVEIVGGGAKWQINGDLNIADRGRGKVKEIDGGEVIANNIKIALLEGANGTLEAIGAGSIARTTVNVEAGLDAAAVEAIVAVYDGGVVNSEADVLLNGGSTVKGNSAVIAANGITASNYTVIVAPGNTDGSPATLTFDSPQYRAGAATTLDIDAPEGGVNDHLHVSGTVSLNGNVSATVGFDPVPWRLDGTGGDYIHVLSSVGALTGTMTGESAAD